MNRKISSLLMHAGLLAVASLTQRTFAWETYPQGQFGTYDIAVQPSGNLAAAVGDGVVRVGQSGGTLWSSATLPPGYRFDHVAVDPLGRILVTGWTQFADGTRAPRIWASDDVGSNWFEAASSFNIEDRTIQGIASDPSGRVYISSFTHNPNASVAFIRTRLGTPDGAGSYTWTLLDTFSSTQSSYSVTRLTIRPKANVASANEVWLAGYASAKTRMPFVRRSLDGGTTWQTAAAWLVPSGYSFDTGDWAVVAAADKNGIAYASASYAKKSRRGNLYYWLTYRSTNAGNSWSLVDTVLTASSTSTGSGPRQIATDSLGGVFITGCGIARVSVDGGNTWVNANVAGAETVCADRVGNVFIGGWTSTGAFIYKLPAPGQ